MADDFLDVDPNTFTLGELCDIQDQTGEDALATIAAGGNPSFKLMTAFVWIMKRRADPSFTFEQAREIKVLDLVKADDA